MTSPHPIDEQLDRYDGYLTSYWMELGNEYNHSDKLQKYVQESAAMGRLFRDKLICMGFTEEQANSAIVERTKQIGNKLAEHRLEFFNLFDRYVLPAGAFSIDRYTTTEAYKKFQKMFFPEDIAAGKQQEAMRR